MEKTTGQSRRFCFVLAIVWMMPVLGLAQDQDWLALSRQASTTYDAGEYQASLDLALRALRAAETFGSRDVRVAATLRRLGLLYYVVGRYAESERAYRRAISILEEDPEDRLLLAHVLEGLALVQMQSGRGFARADELMRHAVAICVEVRGAGHPDVAAMMANLASAQITVHKDSEAQAVLEQALAILERAPREYQSEEAGILGNLGLLAFWRGNISGAESYFKQCVALYEAQLGLNHPQLITPLLNLARVRLELEHAEDAEGPILRAIAIAERHLGSDHPYMYAVYSTYAAVLRKTGRKREAHQMETRAKAIVAANPADISGSSVHISDLYSRKNARNQLSRGRTRDDSHASGAPMQGVE